ncbi:MAG: bifunctional diaminohydroxyphosphoribosylaminopyrimidine deaminase/5-amino-6-(5-phosphoribosylamino)uracil reductase RibD [Devosia sp.]|nr:bifunctional diaminohydroxyphosphoribosylaminopyrimidine deaminase/5-amino-6-(5-phosphoribosylamino)uracil reductase RibD [Devosia sp.]
MGLHKTSAPRRERASEQSIAAAFVRALNVASEYEGATAPNPPVGCVLLDRDGNELAAAAHQKAGQPHAEALAIEQCRQRGTLARIHTVVVTLEPCNHTGRTPPCAEAIARTPAKQIWIGARDPNRLVAGGGAERLSSTGLAVNFIADLDHPDAARLAGLAGRLIAPFAKHARTGLPWVTVKQAIDTAGSMIPPAGDKTFTSPASLILAHQLRKRADAILTGSGTILADRPEFTIRRVPDFPDKRRHLAILDRRGRVPDSYIEAARQRGFEVSLETSVTDAVARLGQLGALDVLVEAGPTVLDAVLSTDLWDEHFTIHQGAGPEGGDLIVVRHRAATGSSPAGREEYVLRNH